MIVICREEPDLHNDIGLIRVTEKIQFSDKVTPLNLPPYDFDVESDGKGLQISYSALLSFCSHNSNAKT